MNNFPLINSYNIRKFNIMACSTCKQKGSSKPSMTKADIERMVIKYEKGARILLVVWSLFAVYGIYSIITKFL
jgi:hypothetical protein